MAVSTDNPFPGMNPFIELRWSDFRTALIGYIRESLGDEVPMDLSIRAEERIEVETIAGEKDEEYRPDVSVTEAWKSGLPPVWQPEGATGDQLIEVAEPEIIVMEPKTERWIEIRDRDGKLVTAIEVLSPSNKKNPGHSKYGKKQARFLASDANLVEIDLLRGGWPTVAMDPDNLKPKPGTNYVICATRGVLHWQREIYRWSIKDPIPNVRIPLRPNDPDVPLALQPMIDRCYRTGRYWQLDYNQKLSPALPDDEAAWANKILDDSGLR